jgi:hypothetical protein
VRYLRPIAVGFVAALVLTNLFSLLVVATVDQTRVVRLAGEALTGGVFTQGPFVFEDHFTECVALGASALRLDSRWLDAIESRWLRPGAEHTQPCMMLSAFLGLTSSAIPLPPPEVSYQYPFGFRYLMLAAFGLGLSVAGVKRLLLVVAYLAVLVLLVAVWRRAQPLLAVPLVLLVAFGLPWYGGNLGHGPSFTVIIATSAVLLLARQWFLPIERRLGVMAALGVTVYYFDISFVIAFALSLILVVHHFGFVRGAEAREAVLQHLMVLFTLAGSFLAAMALRAVLMDVMHGVWVGHWPRVIVGRMSRQVGDQRHTVLDVYAQLYHSLGQLTGSHALAVLLVLASAIGWGCALVVLVRRRRPLALDLGVLVVAAGGVLGWYALMVNHTMVHAFFVGRMLALPIAYGFTAAALAWITEGLTIRWPAPRLGDHHSGGDP